MKVIRKAVGLSSLITILFVAWVAVQLREVRWLDFSWAGPRDVSPTVLEDGSVTLLGAIAIEAMGVFLMCCGGLALLLRRLGQSGRQLGLTHQAIDRGAIPGMEALEGKLK
jgi:hypothetical protein